MGEIVTKFCSPKEVDEPGPTYNDVKRIKKKVEFVDTKCSDPHGSTNGSRDTAPLAYAFDGSAVYSPN